MVHGGALLARLGRDSDKTWCAEVRRVAGLAKDCRRFVGACPELAGQHAEGQCWLTEGPQPHGAVRVVAGGAGELDKR